MTATCSSFPTEVAFTGAWRPFQQDVLDELAEHLADRRFHLVAAPGSGKTVLGLEVVRRLNAPALVLCPTLAIREQWARGVRERFLPAGAPAPGWLGTDLQAPQLLTLVTYQALHAACRACVEPAAATEPEEESPVAAVGEDAVALAARLCAAGVRTVVVDEAHHLRAGWWASLQAVLAKMEGITLVALTATPPYDAPEHEMQRYLRLCGPVDVEVSIPAMVREGNLCPHQDYVYLNVPAEQEARAIDAFYAGVAELIDAIARDNALADAVAAHPWMIEPARHLPEILDDPSYFTALLSFLSATKLSVPVRLPGVLGIDHRQIPRLGPEWLEILLTRALFADAGHYRACQASLAVFAGQLRRIGAVEQGQVVLRGNQRMARLLSGSINKMQSVVEIARLEARALGPDLRLLVLTDFIRKDALPTDAYDAGMPGKLGAATIFDALRREITGDALLGALRDEAKGDLGEVKLGVLTGTLTVLPAAAMPALQACCAARGIDAGSLAICPVPFDAEYVLAEGTGEAAHALVGVVTQLLDNGEITLLVGTHALLGEGWDAPCVNSLVLATTVRTYMLSNQMRGRALRRSPAHPRKVANIWHLVCIDPRRDDPGEDFVLLTRRFKAFAGIGCSENAISNGITRLGMGRPPFTAAAVRESNGRMCAAACDRALLWQRWQAALAAGAGAHMVETLAPRKRALPRTFVRRVLATAVVRPLAISSGILLALTGLLTVVNGGIASPAVLIAIYSSALALVGAASVIGPAARWSRHRLPASSLREVGLALLDALVEARLLHTPRARLTVVVSEIEGGDRLACHLAGGLQREQRLFADALDEVLGPVNSPRYLLVGRRWPGGRRRYDWMPVPAVLGAKKEGALAFARHWRNRVGPMRLVYTRTAEGRDLLLAARCRSFALLPEEPPERVSRWE